MCLEIIVGRADIRRQTTSLHGLLNFQDMPMILISLYGTYTVINIKLNGYAKTDYVYIYKKLKRVKFRVNTVDFEFHLR